MAAEIQNAHCHCSRELSASNRRLITSGARKPAVLATVLEMAKMRPEIRFLSLVAGFDGGDPIKLSCSKKHHKIKLL